MKRVIFDTNIYGDIAIERNSFEIIKKIIDKNELIIYGVDIIEKELQRVPEEKTIKGKKFKDILLFIYNFLIKPKSKTICTNPTSGSTKAFTTLKVSDSGYIWGVKCN